MHGVGVHNPGHGLFVGVDIGRGDVAFRSDEIDDFGGVAAGDFFEFGVREDVRIADYTALAAAEGDIRDRAFPGHPGCQSADFIQGHVGSKTDAALGRPAGHRVLHPVAGEDFQAAVVELHRDVNRDLAGRSAEDFAHAVIELEALGGFIEAHGGGEPGVGFVLQRNGSGCSQRGHGSALRFHYGSVVPVPGYQAAAESPYGCRSARFRAIHQLGNLVDQRFRCEWLLKEIRACGIVSEHPGRIA